MLQLEQDRRHFELKITIVMAALSLAQVVVAVVGILFAIHLSRGVLGPGPTPQITVSVPTVVPAPIVVPPATVTIIVPTAQPQEVRP